MWDRDIELRAESGETGAIKTERRTLNVQHRTSNEKSMEIEAESLERKAKN
ncbi:hypothetical protein DSCW_04330 [Desulfosarcina widdelii]|uniref:Uncharacterized protein n=1 Tax=Desulfosarcina widdelii TaxID=947919 RepID=A0A5K7YUP5_9BACT|nr:hypothetical protein DSCW_04330 [Desulfosarcina widdelii]